MPARNTPPPPASPESKLLDALSALTATRRREIARLPVRDRAQAEITLEEMETALASYRTDSSRSDAAQRGPRSPAGTRLVETAEAARIVGVHRITVVRWIRAGKLKQYRLLGRSRYRVDPDELRARVSETTTGTGSN